MEQRESSKPVIPEPNIDKPDEFNEWLQNYVQFPDRSFADSNVKHLDGTPFTWEERVEATREQLRMGVDDLLGLGRPRQKIVDYVMKAIQQIPGGNPGR